MIPTNHLILCCPLLLPLIFPSIRILYSESVVHIRWPKHLSFSFSINPSNEFSELISFRIDWFDTLAVQRTIKDLLQHHSSKASILQCSNFTMVQLIFVYDGSDKESAYQCKKHKRHGFNPSDRKSPWRRARKPTPVFLPEEFHRLRSLVNPMDTGALKTTDHGVEKSWTQLKQLNIHRHPHPAVMGLSINEFGCLPKESKVTKYVYGI